MNSEKILHAIGEIDDELIKSAAQMPNKKHRRRILLGALAACLCLAFVGLAITRQPEQPPIDSPAADIPVEAVSCYLNGNDYAAYNTIAFDERKAYGLVPADAIGLGPENLYVITDADLGEPMGTVTKCQNEAYIGSPVYHFAAYPDDENICIIDTPAGYQFYTFSGSWPPDEVGQLSDAALEAYGLPASMEKMETLDQNSNQCMEITAEAAEEILRLLSGKTCLGGWDVVERRFADLWQQTYGNDVVYYDEEAKCCIFPKLSQENDPTEYSYEAEDGSIIVHQAPPPQNDPVIYEQAQALWYWGEQQLAIEIGSKYPCYIRYFPSIRIFELGGYYELSPEEAQRLNVLLGIEEVS